MWHHSATNSGSSPTNMIQYDVCLFLSDHSFNPGILEFSIKNSFATFAWFPQSRFSK